MEKAQDILWYERYIEIAEKAPGPIGLFKQEKEKDLQNKKQFMSGEIVNPTFEYEGIKEDVLREAERKLLSLKAEILAEEKNPAIREAYRWKINERIASLRLCLVTKEIELASKENNSEKLARLNKKFLKYSHFIFGVPEKKFTAWGIDGIRKLAEKSLTNEDEKTKTVAQELMGLLPQMEGQEAAPIIPDAVIDLVREQTRKELGKYLELENVPQKSASEDVAGIFDGVLKKMGAEGWQAVVSEKNKVVEVAQMKKNVLIPPGKTYGKSRLESLIAHELGTHVLRRLNGERSKLMLLGLGLDRYEKGDEGVATMREQAVENKFGIEEWLERHVAINLALGIKEHGALDFRNLFELLWRYKYLKAREEGKSDQLSEKNVKEAAYTRCYRTFRGTSGKDKGVAFTKDIVYAEGNVGTWGVIGENPEELMRLSVGKYDPTNMRHLWLLSQLGITDKDLAELEKPMSA